ncbi:sulfonate ABC transporter substrate-binding protein [Rivihabitans pingtungensis]|uniref:sulfonate ABC transporter substrate-binding protein n=1 Tax=Rivihabitans pingtungensis TaxID=1054498 RepID=UPI0023F1DAC8|nr:sulfonate ABC transporter substrate-binding protein [Rivihabitans pingtungensis]
MTDAFQPSRRRLLGALSAAALAAALPRPARAASDTLRIGYQKYGTLVLLKAQGTLEKRLAPLGIQVKWAEFPGGPQLLEALNVGSVDFGTTGETPPIFAQAAGADLQYVAYEPPAPKGEAIVVAKDSPLKSVKDLKGKRVALNKGSNVHYLLVKALEKAGLKYEDVQTVFLNPSDARAAFERGSVDAWVIWDPFLAAAEHQLGARQLADGVGLVSNHQFYLASRRYAEQNGKVVKLIVEELARLDTWARQNFKDVAGQLSSQIGLDVNIVRVAAERGTYDVRLLDAKVIAEQQRIADVFHQLKLIPKPLSVKDIVWSGQ